MQEERGGRKREESRVEGQQKKGGIGGGKVSMKKKAYHLSFVTSSRDLISTMLEMSVSCCLRTQKTPSAGVHINKVLWVCLCVVREGRLPLHVAWHPRGWPLASLTTCCQPQEIIY